MEDIGEQKILDEATTKLYQMFVDRLNAGLPLTLNEWGELGDASKEVWEACYTEFRLKNLALQAHYISDSILGGTLAVETVWDILPKEVQDKFMKLWSKENAKQDESVNERT